ncbi:MAG: PEP-CTERM sorting domain-containing protein [Phycisphaerae bacterium]|nr:PEP-CTERM sorting domain-containing protein [Phycisphaerae bacterium]
MRAAVVMCLLLAAGAPSFGDADSFPLADGTIWCFLGDSITEQNYHINYIESYYHLRFPANQYHFRGCGRGGSTLPEALDRFDADVAIWEPDVVSLEMGLNGNATKAGFTTNLNIVTDRTQAIGAESVYLSLHPMYRLSGHSGVHLDRADAHMEVATARGLNCVDQFGLVWPVWLENLQSPTPVDLQYPGTDIGHPGPSGHLIKTWVILKAMGAPADVSSASFDAAGGTLVSSADCTVTNVAKTTTGVSFTRADDRLPIAVDDDALVGLELRPQIMDEISAYMLEVDGLALGDYKIIIDGVESGVVSAAELAAGYNMSVMTAGPIHEQLQLVRQLILQKEGTSPADPLSVLKRRLQGRYYEDLYDIHGQELVDFMKGLHPTLPQPVGLTTDILPLDEAIHLAAQPTAHNFEIELVPEPCSAGLMLLAGCGLLVRRRRR